MAQASSNSESSLICPICQDILREPVRITCPFKHVYCHSCVMHFRDIPSASCPECRSTFDPSHLEKALDVERALKCRGGSCDWCHKQMSMSKLRDHMSKCASADHSIPHFKPIKETSQSIPRNVPNRSTFECPFCHEKNLDCKSLIKHCNDRHKNSPATAVVCPVCASMPWGDGSRISTNFIQHLNLRHMFEYETFVDYERDDDDMLQDAINASLETY